MPDPLLLGLQQPLPTQVFPMVLSSSLSRQASQHSQSLYMGLSKNWQLVGHSWVRLSVLGGGQGKAESKKERLRARTSQQLWRQAERCVSWEKIDCQTNARMWMDITQSFYETESAANPPAFIFRIFCYFFFPPEKVDVTLDSFMKIPCNHAKRVKDFTSMIKWVTLYFWHFISPACLCCCS